MIARQWLGETMEPDAAAYGKYLEKLVSKKSEPPKVTRVFG
jgi:hypothetical protein